MSPVCQVLVHDLRRIRHGLVGWEECWRQCGYQAARLWVDPRDVDAPPRLVCRVHDRELAQLTAAGLAGQVRWVARTWAPETVALVAEQATTPVPLLPAVAGDGSVQLALEVPQ